MVIATVAVAMPAFLVGTMALQLRQALHFGSAELGIAVSTFYLGAAMSSIPASRLAERIGGIRVMRITAVASSIVLVALGVVVGSWRQLTVLMFLGGALSGAMSPAANLFLARRSPSGQQGFAFGVKQAAVPFASLLGGLAIPLVVLHLGWRWTFALSSSLALLAVVLVPSSQVPLAMRRRRRQEAADVEVRPVPLTVLGIGMGLGVMAASGTTTFLVSCAVSIGYSKAAAGLLVAATGALAVVTRVLSGVRADQRGGGHFRVVAAMLVTGAVGYAVLVAGVVTRSMPMLALGAAVALGAGWGWNGLFNYAVVEVYRAAPAAATGITQVGGRLGGVLGPVLFGVVMTEGSYADMWILGGAAAVCAAGTVLFGTYLLARQRNNVLAGAHDGHVSRTPADHR